MFRSWRKPDARNETSTIVPWYTQMVGPSGVSDKLVLLLRSTLYEVLVSTFYSYVIFVTGEINAHCCCNTCPAHTIVIPSIASLTCNLDRCEQTQGNSENELWGYDTTSMISQISEISQKDQRDRGVGAPLETWATSRTPARWSFGVTYGTITINHSRTST